jgi:hypothetical protein
MADDPSVYGSYMNFFLPQSARVGPSASTPGLFDMLGGMGLSGWPGSSTDQPGTAADQQKKRQQQLALGQQGLKMMQPPAMPAMPADTPMPQQQAAPIPMPPPQVMPASSGAGYNMAGTGLPPRPRPRMPYPFGGYGQR